MEITAFVDYELFAIKVETVAPLDAPIYSSTAVLKALPSVHRTSLLWDNVRTGLQAMQGRTHVFSPGGTKLGTYTIPSAPVTASGIYPPFRARVGETAKFDSQALRRRPNTLHVSPPATSDMRPDQREPLTTKSRSVRPDKSPFKRSVSLTIPEHPKSKYTSDYSRHSICRAI
jgi:hypothetical protein